MKTKIGEFPEDKEAARIVEEHLKKLILKELLDKQT